MKRLYKFDDFEAMIRIFRPDEGGRSRPAANGVRWDFTYKEEPHGFHMIYPDFFDESGDSIPEGEPLPIDKYLPVRMMILMDETRAKVHRARMQEGTEFYCLEGPHRVAEGRVTRITGLHDKRSDRP